MAERDDEEMRASRGDFIVDLPEKEEEDQEEEESEEEERDDDEEEEDSGDEEEEEEDGGEDDADDDEADEEGDKSPKQSRKDNRVPKSRLDRVIAQREEQKDRADYAEEQLAQALKNQVTAAPAKQEAQLPEYDYLAKSLEADTALLAGDQDTAAKIRVEIQQQQKKELLAELKAETSNAVEAGKQGTSEVIMQAKVDTLVEDLEAEYPFLDQEAESYNEEALATVNSLMAGYITQGEPHDVALALAVKKILPLYRDDEPSNKEALGQKRTKKARKRAVDANNKQPPKSRGSRSGKDSSVDDVKVESLNEKQYKTLTKKEKAILRGDIIA